MAAPESLRIGSRRITLDNMSAGCADDGRSFFFPFAQRKIHLMANAMSLVTPKWGSPLQNDEVQPTLPGCLRARKEALVSWNGRNIPRTQNTKEDLQLDL